MPFSRDAVRGCTGKTTGMRSVIALMAPAISRYFIEDIGGRLGYAEGA